MANRIIKPSPDWLATVGGRVRSCREKLGVSQRELASRCDISCGTISFLEAGRIDARGSTLLRLSRSLRVSVDWLLMGEEVTL